MCPQEILFVIIFKLVELANVHCHELSSSVLGAVLDFISSLMLIAYCSTLLYLFIINFGEMVDQAHLSCIHYSGYRYHVP